MNRSYGDLLRQFGIFAAQGVNGVYCQISMGIGDQFINVLNFGAIRGFGYSFLSIAKETLTWNLT
jgi:hypothetical protein